MKDTSLRDTLRETPKSKVSDIKSEAKLLSSLHNHNKLLKILKMVKL